MSSVTAFMATKLFTTWKAMNVELQGKYSTQRVQALFQYHDYVNNIRVLFVMLVTPLPCFLLIMAIDAVPLRPISEGVHSSQLFFVRAFVCFWIASITAYGQIKHIVQSAPLPHAKIVYFSAVVAGITVIAMYGLTRVIGYPLPFGIVTVSPVWVHLLLAPLLTWMKNARADPTVWPIGKTAFSLLLPIMKIFLRGIIANTVLHLKDEIPQIVVINVDLFSALFSTYCMQNAPSLKTTGVLMAAKVLQTSVSLYDIELVVQRMKALKKQGELTKVVSVQGKGRSSENTNALAEQKPNDSRVSPFSIFALVQASTRKLSKTIQLQPLKKITSHPHKTHGLHARISPLLSEFTGGDRHGSTKNTVVESIPPLARASSIGTSESFEKYFISRNSWFW
ncbi:unnamed protein product [Phytophthora fragariaefolia]|uniref:Unnamed protein product n=1 Tax=Phytophthora fragariaefolia TaxID=1490495 RepID=A0A9W6XEU0_9STRA|nr:unnamed protein product [Phytophthora fragariaefolia]